MRLADLAGKRVCLLGFGKEGQATLRAIERSAPGAQVTIADGEPSLTHPSLPVIAGPDYLTHVDAADFDVIVKSPGIPPTPVIETWRASGRLTSATQLFFAEAQAAGSWIVGITGSKGKSTTTTLIWKLLLADGHKAVLVGNIGRPSLDDLEQAQPNTIFVHELSSYQLNDSQIRPDVAVVTSFFPEHLNYHGTLEAYWEAKARICRFQTQDDTVVYQSEFPDCGRIAALCPGKRIAVTCADAPVTLDEIRLRGRHNLGNIALAVAVADHFGISRETQLPILRSFEGLPHRLQSLGTHAGIEWVDDAISTTPDSAVAALDALGDRVKTIILGGQDRGLEFGALGERLRGSSVTTALLFPGSGPRIRQAIAAAGAAIELVDVDSMDAAVTEALARTPKQDPAAICLLSTASPSYGMFKNFEEKGDAFRKEVLERT